ncbi:hypothetical protein FLA_1197 [Filimonas lacunae]|nr:hypothetical protein FLA_1197 [Filimonas lacunae]
MFLWKVMKFVVDSFCIAGLFVGFIGKEWHRCEVLFLLLWSGV